MVGTLLGSGEAEGLGESDDAKPCSFMNSARVGSRFAGNDPRQTFVDRNLIERNTAAKTLPLG